MGSQAATKQERRARCRVSWTTDGEPRYVATETVSGTGSPNGVVIYDRATCHRPVWSGHVGSKSPLGRVRERAAEKLAELNGAQGVTVQAFEAVGAMRETLTYLADTAADLEDPRFSVAVAKATNWVIEAGEALTALRTAERSTR